MQSEEPDRNDICVAVTIEAAGPEEEKQQVGACQTVRHQAVVPSVRAPHQEGLGEKGNLNPKRCRKSNDVSVFPPFCDRHKPASDTYDLHSL